MTAGIEAAYKALISTSRLSANSGQAALVNRYVQNNFTIDYLSETSEGVRLVSWIHADLDISRLANLQTDLESRNDGVRGLYIYGGVGTGKSRMADLFSETLPSSITRRRAHLHGMVSKPGRRESI
jgi:predicted ATPase